MGQRAPMRGGYYPGRDELSRVGEGDWKFIERKAAIIALLAFGVAIWDGAVGLGWVAVLVGMTGVVASAICAHAQVQQAARPAISRWADEPPLEIEGLSETNVRCWHANAVAALMEDRVTSEEFEAALDHLVRRRGPIGSDGRPISGAFRPNGTGGFEKADPSERVKDGVVASLSVPPYYVGETSEFPTVWEVPSSERNSAPVLILGEGIRPLGLPPRPLPFETEEIG